MSVRDLALLGVATALMASACATRTGSAPVEFYASWSGEHEPTAPLFRALDARLRAEPGFRRGFGEALNVHLGDGTPTSNEKMRHAVRMAVARRYLDRRLSERDRVLASFEVTCDPKSPEPCVEQIVGQARRQSGRLRRIVARSPKA